MDNLCNMTRLPKSIKSHYIDSFEINLETLRSFLLSSRKIQGSEVDEICLLISKIYNQKVNYILTSCENDWNKLEPFSSPLIIFVQCIEELLSQEHLKISSECKFILKSFTKTLESWMIW